MPQYVSRRAPARNRSVDLADLLSWRPITEYPSRAAKKLARRFGFSLETAATLAALAGLGGEV